MYVNGMDSTFSNVSYLKGYIPEIIKSQLRKKLTVQLSQSFKQIFILMAHYFYRSIVQSNEFFWANKILYLALSLSNLFYIILG